MSKVTPITSPAHFHTLTSSSTYTIVDFHATWCGPCKVIAPIFEQLATAETKPGKIVFCKVDVDEQREVAGRYGVSAMPTFLILKGGSVKETVRGANATQLRTAVLSAAADAAKVPAKSSAGTFSGKGQSLGATTTPDGTTNGSRYVPAPSLPNFGAMLSSPATFAQGSGFPQTAVRFLGLYFTSLFSLDPEAAARESPFALQRGGGGGSGSRVGSVR
ncbi:hypothetical protein LTR78_004116 [Recurvomyces mirabilis]|uniref:Thioredoxin domain-containing protein n=1 Tax=Recurvomyces mirabilis TaxID=574656 RepID=A0AAE0WQG2_9PEZI|nr:hypothetical protein LTR78_004116 [Recurvomyces mirabilis]KAK5153712.1 hypothetical protein LTS14_007406 [Recurvomyces mirabilis]